MKIKAVLFDLDGTLLPMDYEMFVKAYFGAISEKMVSFGYEPKELIKNVWAGTDAMKNNVGRATNEEVFWESFCRSYGQKALDDKKHFDSFYANEFEEVKKACSFNPKAAEVIKYLKGKGILRILATNPIFPETATKKRINWAGIDHSDFAYCTTYENSHFCKPRIQYYAEILEKNALEPSECLMVGNDVDEDGAAELLGVQVFLLTDCLLNKNSKDHSHFPKGNFDDLTAFLKDKIEE